VGQIEAVVGQSESEAQIAKIYAEHAPALRRRCLRLTGNVSLSDDLMQETLARFIARFPHLADDLDVRAYLFATARNLWIDHLRREGDVATTEIDDARTQDERIATDPLRALLLAEQRGEVQLRAAALTDRQRRALTLRELGDQSYAEIGSELGLQTNAVAQIVWRARTQLRRSLRRSQIDEGVLSADCRARLNVISDLVDETTSSHTAALETHLADCKDCRRTLAAFQEAGSRLRGFLPVVPLAAIATRIGTALRMGDAVTSSLGSAAVVTAAVVATAGGGGALMEHYGALPAWHAATHHASTRATTEPSLGDHGRPVARVLRRATVRLLDASASNGPSGASEEARQVRASGAAGTMLAPSPIVHQRVAPRPQTPPRQTAPGPTVPAADPPQSKRPQPVRPPETVQEEPRSTPARGSAPPVESTKTPPGQAKKTKDAVATPTLTTPSTPEKAPPGQAKKAKDSAATPTGATSNTTTKKTPPGQAKKAANTTSTPDQTSTDTAAKTPPGQAKKAAYSSATPTQSASTATTPALPGKNKHGATATTTEVPAAVTPPTPTPASPPPTDTSTAPTAPTAVPSTTTRDQPKTANATTPAQPPPATSAAPAPPVVTAASAEPTATTPSASPDGTSSNAPGSSATGNGKGKGRGEK
jgi:RNA polymerase sigma factor (sigma-70 family)